MVIIHGCFNEDLASPECLHGCSCQVSWRVCDTAFSLQHDMRAENLPAAGHLDELQTKTFFFAQCSTEASTMRQPLAGSNYVRGGDLCFSTELTELQHGAKNPSAREMKVRYSMTTDKEKTRYVTHLFKTTYRVSKSIALQQKRSTERKYSAHQDTW